MLQPSSKPIYCDKCGGWCVEEERDIQNETQGQRLVQGLTYPGLVVQGHPPAPTSSGTAANRKEDHEK